MKVFHQYLFIFTLLFSATLKAQLTEVIPPILADSRVKSEGKGINNKSTSCGVDTLYYSRYNNSSTTPKYLNLQPTRGAGMYFAIDDTVWLSGFNFFGYALLNGFFLTPQVVTCNVYYANANRLPAGIALASQSFTINATNYTMSGLRQKCLFTTPVQLVSDFVITVEFAANLPNRIVLAANDYDSLDGYGRQYSCVRIGNNWANNLTVDSVPFDADFLMEPVVEYKMSANFDHGLNACLGNGLPFEFVNKTSFALNPQFSKEMVDSSLEDNFIWDYGDGSPEDTMLHGVHLYPGTFGYFVKLTGEFENWVGNSCADDTLIFIEKGEVDANFTFAVNGKIVMFTNKSQNAFSYEWDFDDGSPRSIQKDPVRVFQNYGTYFVKLKSRNKGCIDSLILQVDVYDFTSVQNLQLEKLEVTILPNPAVDKVIIASNLQENQTGNWLLFNIQGKELSRGLYSKETILRMDDYENGLYFIRLEYNGSSTTRRIVISK